MPTADAELIRNIFGTLLECRASEYDVRQVAIGHFIAVTQPAWFLYPVRSTLTPGGELSPDLDDAGSGAALRTALQGFRPDIFVGFGPGAELIASHGDYAGRKPRILACAGHDGLVGSMALERGLSRADRFVLNSHAEAKALLRLAPKSGAGRVYHLYPPADTQRFCSLTAEEKVLLRTELLPHWVAPDAFIAGWIGRNRWKHQIWVFYKALRYLRHGGYRVCSDCGRSSLSEWDPTCQCCVEREPWLRESRSDISPMACSHCASESVSAAEPIQNLIFSLHMPLDDPASEWPHWALEYQFGVKRGRDLHYTEGYGIARALRPEDMPNLYGLWDCVIGTDASGFGLPTWEAMACGIPVVHGVATGASEHVVAAESGVPVRCVLQPQRRSTAWRAIPEAASLVDAIRHLYFDKNLRESLR